MATQRHIYIYTYILLLVRHTCRLTYKQHMWAEPLLNQRIACVEYVFFRGKGKCFLISMQHVQHVIMTACAPAPERHMVQPSHGFCWLHQSCICVFFFKNNRFSYFKKYFCCLAFFSLGRPPKLQDRRMHGALPLPSLQSFVLAKLGSCIADQVGPGLGKG